MPVIVKYSCGLYFAYRCPLFSLSVLLPHRAPLPTWVGKAQIQPTSSWMHWVVNSTLRRLTMSARQGWIPCRRIELAH